jgi:hypothetical protein
MLGRALRESGLAPLDRAKLLPAMVELDVACGCLDAASAGVSELEADRAGGVDSDGAAPRQLIARLMTDQPLTLPFAYMSAIPADRYRCTVLS